MQKKRFENMEVIYASPYSKIYQGLDCDTGNTIILKTGGQDYISSETVERLKHEYQVMKMVDNPHVVKTLGEVMLDGRYYLMEEFYPGTVLNQLIKQKPFELSDFYLVASQIIEGLGAIHKAGIIHKDINPFNIIFDEASKRVVLLDMGISSVFSYEKTEGIKLDNIEGTLRYIAPEQTGHMNVVLDYRADFYALGITFYEMLTQRCPFEADTPTEMVFAHLAKTPQNILSLASNVPPMLAEIINKLLSKMAKDRYSSCEGLLYDLKRSMKESNFVLGEKDFSRRFEFSREVYGRENEVIQLKKDYEEVVNGGKVLVSISGYSGIGKTTLVNEIQEEVLLSNGMFLQGKFDQYHSNVPYYAFFQAIRQFCNMVFLESEEYVDKWKNRLSEALGSDASLLTSKVTELSLLTGDYPVHKDLTPLEERLRFKDVLGKLLSFLALPEHPLILFLDDVHLADMGSMEMLEDIIKNEEINHLMIVVCYRDNEVTQEHPIIHSLNKIIQKKGRVTQFNLKGLSEKSTMQMIGDILKTNVKKAAHLTEIIYNKTKGNPFYIKQFMQLCYLKGYLMLDMDTGSWYWDEENIQNCPAQTNVVDFILGNIEQIPAKTLSLLSFGACIGQSFYIDDLEVICGLPEEEINKRLIVAVALELIFPIEKNVDTGKQSRFQFSHDRFQQVFYLVMPEKERANVHYQLGKLYEQKALEDDDFEELLFKIADHYAKALKEIEKDGVEMQHIQEILLMAANRGGLVSAFDTASHYLTLLLSQPDFQYEQNSAFLTKIYIEYHAVLCNLVNVKECDCVYEKLCEMVENPVDLVDSCCLHITSLSNRGEYEAGFMLGVSLLKQLGVPFFKENIDVVLEEELELFYQEREALGKDYILSKQESTEPLEFEISKLLCRMVAPALFYNPNYAYWTVLTAARRIFKFGYTPYSLQMYANLMMPLGVLCEDYLTAYKAGKAAMELAEKHQYREVIYSIYHLFALHTCHWFEDIINVIPYARESIKGNAQTGEFEYACYGFFNVITAITHTATHIEELWVEIGPAFKFGEKTGNYHCIGAFYSFRQFCRSLRGELSFDGSFEGEDFIVKNHLEEFANNQIALCYYYVLRAFTAIIYGDYKTALWACEKAVVFLPNISCFYNVALHNFLYSLSICKILEAGEYENNHEISHRLIDIVKHNQCWLERRKDEAFNNFGHLYLVIDAECKTACGHIEEAMPLYECALEQAKQHDGILHHALICDLVAQRYKSLGIKSVWKYYLRRTYRLYMSWGAEGKCAQMRSDYPELQKMQESADMGQYTQLDVATYTTTSLDMKAVLKASMAISEELRLESILEKLIYILLESAGAQNIYYLNKSNNQYEIQAEGHTGLKDTCIISKRMANEHEIPLSIVKYVERTSETVILDDASNSRIYGKDVHVKEYDCKSIMCMPILSKGKLRGILYLENNLASRVFDQRRKDNLIPIATQLAISLENAYLYEHLQYLVEERTKALQEEIQVRKKAEEKLAQMANYDSLTELPNRRMFNDILSKALIEAKRDNHMLAVLFVDLDGFKVINDTHGHEKGDTVLVEVARRLCSAVRKDDTVSRMGGDEFVLILKNVKHDTEIKKVCERILHKIREPLYIFENYSLQLTVSIGISVYPKDSQDGEELVISADHAMYWIKKRNKNHYLFAQDLATGGSDNIE
ncbi:diguanylate cyclase domain protein [Clostridioides difficile DA00160]|uniref:diguanylate cyclase domain-containing protein n=2 Tax=Clostridioides difficile TaxID=1496 RepID=UPI00038CB5B7|nr:diguanylate cyclase [Clostridioides difficile]EQG68979.1 diguanylate cyclase domain protein [Clostridioides difficile DA00160]